MSLLELADGVGTLSPALAKRLAEQTRNAEQEMRLHERKANTTGPASYAHWWQGMGHSAQN